jgi:hypothetical protein
MQVKRTRKRVTTPGPAGKNCSSSSDIGTGSTLRCLRTPQRGVPTSYFFRFNSSVCGLLEEIRHGHWIEVKHLGAGQLSITQLIKAEHLAIKSFS